MPKTYTVGLHNHLWQIKCTPLGAIIIAITIDDEGDCRSRISLYTKLPSHLHNQYQVNDLAPTPNMKEESLSHDIAHRKMHLAWLKLAQKVATMHRMYAAWPSTTPYATGVDLGAKMKDENALGSARYSCAQAVGALRYIAD